MAFHLMATVKDSYDALFKLMCKKHATHIQPIGHTSLDTTSHTYSRTMAAAYYMNIIEQNDLEDFYKILSVLELKTKKILGDEWQEHRHYCRDWNEDFRKQWKDHPNFIDAF
tara:strand:- start:387 stop:722 length:336 start_codon:yes stop_codon:yes gene_type:complete